MYTKHLNKNNQFMFGIFALVVAVFMVVGIFLYMCYEKAAEINVKREFRIELSQGFVGDSIQVWLNDSLVYEHKVPNDSVVIAHQPTDDQYMLSVEDMISGQARNMNVHIKSGRLILQRAAGKGKFTLKEIADEKK